jgi:RNA polymerase sigma factor (sigma-70 family)
MLGKSKSLGQGIALYRRANLLPGPILLHKKDGRAAVPHPQWRQGINPYQGKQGCEFRMNEKELGEFFADFRKRMMASLITRRIPRDKAEDITQKAMAVSWEWYEKHKHEGKTSLDLMQFGFGVARMTLKEGRRGERHEQLPGGDWQTPDPGLTPEQLAARQETAAGLESAILRLEGRCRQVMLLFLKELDRGEIAARLGITPNNVGVAENRCARQLRKMLTGEQTGQGYTLG